MIQAWCGCGWEWACAESAPAAEAARACPRCGAALVLACGETLPDGAGAGDFDAILEIVSGPEGVGRRYYLGGVAELVIGKHETSQVLLAGKMVSRRHAQLRRVDFGPSRWALADNASTNGLFVNGERVTGADAVELADGDVVRVGEYELRFAHALPVAAPRTPASVSKKAAAAAPPTGAPCPSCERPLPAKAKICVACGIKVDTGRPLLLSADTDESLIHGNAETYITLLSWIVWITPLPIPLFSEAFGTKKPYAIRAIAILTCLASLAFLVGAFGASERRLPGQNFMLWPPSAAVSVESSDDDGAESELIFGEPFHAYQLLTHAFLHDPSSILGFAGHLGGNLLFMLVFGSRVNALIGNVATAIIYPILAVGAAGVYLWLGDPGGPMIGASGAINGLAGMYLVLFPVHRVYCGMWFRFRWWVSMKIFAIRGFWVLLIYFAYDALMVGLKVSSSTAHWAHVGGFLIGVLIALGLLVSRQFNCGGGDLLSVALGRRAWALIGRPAQWNRAATA